MVKTPEEFPSDFCIANYARVAALGPQEWAVNIEHRLLIRSFLQMAEAGSEDARTAAGTLIEALLRDPVLTGQHGPDSMGTLMSRAGMPPALIPPRLPPLAPMTVERWRRIGGSFLGSAVASEKSRLEAVQSFDAFAPKEDWAYGDRVAFVLVNLDASDEEIQADLRHFLTEARREALKKAVPLTPRHMEQWHRNAVLPYADLLLWQQWTGHTITEEQVMGAVLPEAAHGVEKPLKGARRDYAKIFNRETLELLKQMH